MDRTFGYQLRKTSLYCFVAFLSMTALLAIVFVLFGDFGHFEVKVLTTTGIITVCGICSLCCGGFAESRGHYIIAGAGAGLSYISGALLISGIWFEMQSRLGWEVMIVVTIFAIAAALSLALLIARLKRNHLWIQVATVAIILVLGMLSSLVILGDIDNDAMLKVIVVLAILVALGTLVIPVLHKINKSEKTEDRKITLTRLEDGRYICGDGRIFELKELGGDRQEG